MYDDYVFWGIDFDKPFVFWPLVLLAVMIWATLYRRWEGYRARKRYEKYIKENPPVPDNLTRYDFATDKDWQLYKRHYQRKSRPQAVRDGQT